MTLKELRAHIASFPDGHAFAWSLSDPFSWRGSYEEVAFSILPYPSTKESVLSKINSAFGRYFTGYKGGQYKFDGDTCVNFEESIGAYSDDRYALEILSKVLGLNNTQKDLQTLLVSEVFK